MDENNSIQLFEDRKIRTAWDEEKEEWYFSVVDVIAVLTDLARRRRPGAHRGDHRPGAGHRPGTGDLPEEGL